MSDSNVIPMARFGPSMPNYLVDSLQNVLSGLGTTKDKLMNTRFMTIELTQEQLVAAYRSDWISRKIVDIPAFDATREWRAWQADSANIEAIEKVERELFLQQKTKNALTRARLFGGGALVMGIAQGQPQDEVNLDQIRQGDLKFIHVCSRYELTAGPLNLDLMSPYYGEPQYYTRSMGGAVQIHPSRVVRFIGSEMPDIHLFSAQQGWGDSVLQIVQDAAIAAGSVTQSAAQLVQEAKTDIVRVPGLTGQMGNAEYENRLKRRFGLASDAKSIYNMLLLDKEEEWQRITIAWTGLPDILQIYLLIASGAADIPATRMLGQSPAGLSATGESDTRNYYDRISTEQNTIIRPNLSRLDEVLIRSALGSRDESIFYNWNSLWQLSDKEKAEIAKSKADTWQIDVNSGLFNEDLMREARAAQLKEDGIYPGIDQLIDDFGTEPEEPEIPEELEGFAGVNNPPANNNRPPAEEGATDPELDPDNLPDEDGAVAPSPIPPRRRRAADKSPLSLMLDAIKSGDKIKDADPKTLYVRRDVKNANEILAWAQEQGIANLYSASELHVTIAYSRKPMDWTKIDEAWGQDERGHMRVAPGGVRMMCAFGPNKDTLVLVFTSSNLTWRHCDIIRAGASYDYPEYQPHISIAAIDKGVSYDNIEPFRGEIVLGPEIFEEVKGVDFDPRDFVARDTAPSRTRKLKATRKRK